MSNTYYSSNVNTKISADNVKEFIEKQVWSKDLK
jgi:hypothetical protein